MVDHTSGAELGSFRTATEMYLDVVDGALYKVDDAIAAQRSALEEPLAPPQLVAVHSMLGVLHERKYSNSGLEPEEYHRHPDWALAKSHLESAVQIDREKSVGHFANPAFEHHIGTLDLIYAHEAWMVWNSDERLSAALSLGESRLAELDYLPRNPLFYLASWLVPICEALGRRRRVRQLKDIIRNAPHTGREELWREALTRSG